MARLWSYEKAWTLLWATIACAGWWRAYCLGDEKSFPMFCLALFCVAAGSLVVLIELTTENEEADDAGK